MVNVVSFGLGKMSRPIKQGGPPGKQGIPQGQRIIWRDGEPYLLHATKGWRRVPRGSLNAVYGYGVRS